MNIIYPYTNETLEAIIAGLDVKEGDKVFAILGSGDQAFALLEKAGSVLAADNDPRQIEYAEARKKCIEADYFKGFRDIGKSPVSCLNYDMERSNEYFTDERLERVRQKLGKLDIREGDFMQFLGKEMFTKVYMSNAIGHKENISYDAICEIARRIADSMKINGLLYVSNNRTIQDARNYVKAFPSCRKDEWPAGLVQDLELTYRARDLEVVQMWDPAVFRRVA